MLHKQGSILGQDQDNEVLIPYGTAHSLLGGASKENIQIELKVNDTSQMDVTADRIRQLLRRQHNLKNGQDDDFKVQTASQFTDSFKSILDMLTLVLGGIVGVSLLVGGIGIMNIMLVSVTERTREIGILKSLGARRSDILVQFLLEAVALSMLGGIIGLILGYGIGQPHRLRRTRLPRRPCAALGGLVSIGFSTSIGVIFGITPAAKGGIPGPHRRAKIRVTSVTALAMTHQKKLIPTLVAHRGYPARYPENTLLRHPGGDRRRRALVRVRRAALQGPGPLPLP